MKIETVIDEVRGCGWRKPGGLYLIASGAGRSCGKLPFDLTICPTCGGGIHRARGWTWIDTNELFRGVECKLSGETLAFSETRTFSLPGDCGSCPLHEGVGRAGLLWIGSGFYKDALAFDKEAARLGISRRIPAIPRGFVVGETWVALAHAKGDIAFGKGVDKKTPMGKDYFDPGVPAIFKLFKPERVEYITRGDETDAELAALVKRGVTPVHVERGYAQVRG
jgi:hypothetical protein